MKKISNFFQTFSKLYGAKTFQTLKKKLFLIKQNFIKFEIIFLI